MNTSSNESARVRMDRRTAIKWMLTAAASMSALNRFSFGAETDTPSATGYGTDPNLTIPYKAGDVWPLTLTEAQRKTVAALCDVILPADDVSPSASALGVPDFIDEWISAPYPMQVEDRRRIIEGLAWIDEESKRRHGKLFAEIRDDAQVEICEAICYVPEAAPENVAGARFFARFRDLATGGFYTTPEGFKDIGYVGNIPLASFDGPPLEVLKRVGLA